MARMNITANIMYGQIVGFTFAFVSAVGVTATCTWNQWSKTNGPASSSLLNSIWGFNGIWIQCLQYTVGQFQCDDYATAIFDMPVYMNTIRAFMCIAMFTSIGGCLTALLGMQCSRLFDSLPNLKRRLIFITAGMFLISGSLTSASIIWYIIMLMNEFFSASNQDNSLRYATGATIWVGVVTALLCYVTSLIFFCLPGPRDEPEPFVPFTPSKRPLPMRTNYVPATLTTNTEKLIEKDPSEYV